MSKFKVIGLGGIGSYLIEPLSRFLSYEEGSAEITLIDGDSYEEKNSGRQKFTCAGNKAEVTRSDLKHFFPRIRYRSKPEYITEENVISLIRENDIVFACVDNHATRKIISDRCDELENVVLISGGNDYTSGNVIVYVREHDEEITKSPTSLYPNSIGKPQDINPGDQENVDQDGCMVNMEEKPQLIITNNDVASKMLGCYYLWLEGKLNFNEVHVDVLTQRSRPIPDNMGEEVSSLVYVIMEAYDRNDLELVSSLCDSLKEQITQQKNTSEEIE